MHVLYNRTLLIRAAIADVRFTIAVSIVLVVMVLLMFLRRFWITVIPALTIPISIAGTLAVIYALGFSLDNISLLAVTIAVGFVIDDSVIIVENISRRVEAGEAPLDAAVKGTRQLGFTVISIAVALVAALIPNFVHARCRRAFIPRVRLDPGGRDRHVHRRRPHVDPDDVRPTHKQPRRGANRSSQRCGRTNYRRNRRLSMPAVWDGRFGMPG